MLAPAPQTLAALRLKDASGTAPNGFVYTEEWNLVLAALQGLAVAHPEIAAQVDGLLTAYPGLAQTLGGLVTLVNSLDIVGGVLSPNAVPLLTTDDLPALYQVLDAWALSRGLAITIPAS